MKRTGTYLSWALFGFTAQIIFLSLILLFGLNISFINLFSVALVVLLFSSIRYVIEWEKETIVPETISKELRDYIVYDSVIYKLMLGLFGSVLMAVANYNALGVNQSLIILYFCSVSATWVFFDFVRKTRVVSLLFEPDARGELEYLNYYK